VKLFISWSGDLSHKVALHLRGWLPVVLPFVEPWVSSQDIPKGSRWSKEIAAELDATDVGILCVVPSNTNEPWLLFEAGALSKSMDQARVHPFLLGVETEELPGPLRQFQATRFEKADVRKLVTDINASAETGRLPSENLARNFETCWPDLDRRLQPLANEARATPAAAVAAEVEQVPPPATLTDEDISVLRLMCDSGSRVFPKDAGEQLGIHPERVRFLMERLEKLGLVHAAHNYVYGTSWYLSSDGRATLVERGLL
jgi:DNA-binding CsgD family transcriptional regulator